MISGIKRPNYAAFWVAGIVFVAFLTAGLFFILSVHRHNTEESLRFMNDAVSQTRSALNQQFKGDLQILKGVAVSFSEMEAEDREKAYNVLSIINDSNSFISMGVADRSGKAILVDDRDKIHYDADLSSRNFFKAALRGEDAVSPTFFDDLSDEYVNYYAVPIFDYEEVTAVLVAANDDDILRNIIAVPVFKGRGYYFVLDSTGVTVLPTINQDIIAGLGSSAFQVADFEEAERAKLSDALANGTDGNFHFSYMGKDQLAVLQPLGVNDWYVLGVVPRDVIGSYYNRTSAGAAVIIVTATLIFILHIYWQFSVVARNRKELEYLAYTDLLTKVRNYPRFLLDAGKLLGDKGGRPYAIWSFDVKQFGRINELYGNDAGDEVLIKIAELLEEHIGDGILCRNSADQFTGLMPYVEREDLCVWSERIFDAISGREAIHKGRMRLDGAIGIYCIDDFDDLDKDQAVDKMVNRAVAAKKRTKETAGSSAVFFTDEMRSTIHREVKLEAGSRASLSAGHITFYLQPKVCIQGECRITGAEALARWDDPTFGKVSPGDFIPLFERNGFIVELDRAIFEQVCRWYGGWLRAGRHPVLVSVNVSRQGLLNDDFISYYAATKEKHGIPDGLLELEFTESVILNDYRHFCETVEELQKAGFACSIDDFGSGYSSLNVLKNLPIDVLKLDALFFRGEDSLGRANSVVENFIALARKLQIKTVAEGVEEKPQVEFLQSVGCDLIQGYFFSPPLPPAEFELLDPEVGCDLKFRNR